MKKIRKVMIASAVRTPVGSFLGALSSLSTTKLGSLVIEEALKKVKPSVNKYTMDVYKKIEENFLQSAKAALPIAGSYLG